MLNEQKIIPVTKPAVRRPLGRPTHRWEDTIKMDFKEIEFLRVWAGFVCGSFHCRQFDVQK